MFESRDVGFATGVREICRSAYADAGRGGRPGKGLEKTMPDHSGLRRGLRVEVR